MKKYFISLFVLSQFLFAYVGPGPGLSLLFSMWGVIGALLFSVFIMLSWPVRMLAKRLQKFIRAKIKK